MKKPPENLQYWLSRDGADVQGPYSLQQIERMHQMDPFPAETPMKSDDADTWSTLDRWFPSAKPKVIPKEPHPTPLTEAPRSRVFLWLIVGVVVLMSLAYWLTLK
ncbi:MAG: hypothetical protein ACAI34_03115 [Verrucomicrobium sp.]